MKKNKTIKMVLNGAILAAIAVIGVTAYQLGTAPLTENTIPQEEYAENTDELDDDFLSDPWLAEAEFADQETEEEFVEGSKVLEEEETDADALSDSLESTDTQAVELETSEETETDMDTESAASENVAAERESVDVAEDVYAIEEDWNEETNLSEEAAAVVEMSFSKDSEMIWPVKGTIIQDYNMEQTIYFPTLDQYKLSPAIAIQAEEGTAVVAAAEGVVSWIVNDACTGTTVTMELGDGYQAIYGQLRDLTVEDGQTVQAGEIIGYVHTPTKYYTLEGSNLYFAMKENGKPVDPTVYLP